jgi:signal transduction histidine kinase
MRGMPLVTSLQLLSQRSLARRMLLVQVAAFVLMLATLFVVQWQVAARLAKADAEQDAEQFANVLPHIEDPARNAQQLIARLLAPADELTGFTLHPDDEIRFEIRDASGELLAGSDASLKSVAGDWVVREFRESATGRTASVAVSETASRSFLNRDVMHLMSRVSLVMLVLIAPLMLLTTLVLTQFGFAPVRELGHNIATRTSDNLAPIATARRYPELTPLVDELNRLLEKLREAQVMERRFFADAAHELLTPVAALRAQIHLLATAPDAIAKARARSDVDSGLQRVASTIRQLLAIARVSSAELRLDLQLRDLVPLAQERLGVAASRALDKGIEIDLQAPRECCCRYDYGTMVTVLDNLIDNAIRYVPAPGRIRVKLRRYEHATWITVADNGPGIPSDYRDRVFERFFRVPGTSETGSGLGLSIVARIVALHGGMTMLHGGMDARGLMVCIRLPSIPSATRLPAPAASAVR